MEWRFGVTASNEEVSHCGSSFLQLKLLLDKGNNKTQTVHMGESPPKKRKQDIAALRSI